MTVRKTNKTFTDIMGTKLSNSSLLKMFNIYQDELDNMFLNIFKTYVIDESILENYDNTEMIGVVSPWWENISFSYYSDVDSWWVPALANNVINPFEELDENISLKVIKPNLLPYIQRDMKGIYEL